MAARILIVDDHEVVRQGVRSILAERPEWQICGEAASGAEAIHAAAMLHPDVVIMDITMPQMSGLEASSRIVSSAPDARILIFTMHESSRLADEVREAGAHGYVQKSQASRDLVLAIERLLSGDTFFEPESGARSKRKKSGNPVDNTGYCLRASLCFA